MFGSLTGWCSECSSRRIDPQRGSSNLWKGFLTPPPLGTAARGQLKLACCAVYKSRLGWRSGVINLSSARWACWRHSGRSIQGQYRVRGQSVWWGENCCPLFSGQNLVILFPLIFFLCITFSITLISYFVETAKKGRSNLMCVPTHLPTLPLFGPLPLFCYF